MVVPKKGDIIRFPRGGFDHYGIYIGEGKVAHRSGGPGGPSTASASTLSFSGVKNSKAGIRVDKLEDVAGDSKQAEIANYLDEEMDPFPPDEIVERAMSKEGEGGYNVVFRNCEHFVTWCRYGKEYSQQVVDKFIALGKLFLLQQAPAVFVILEVVRMFRKVNN